MARAEDVRTDMQMVPIGELGGKVRHLKFDLNAFAELESRFGTIDKAMDALQKGQMGGIKLILWAGLIHDEVVLDEDTGEPIKFTITPYAVGSWISPNQLPYISEQLVKAISSGMPEVEEEDEKAKAAAVLEAAPEGMATIVQTEEEIQEAEEAKNE